MSDNVNWLVKPDNRDLRGFVSNLMALANKKQIDELCIYYSDMDGNSKMFVKDPANKVATIGYFELFQQLLADIVYNEAIGEG